MADQGSLNQLLQWSINHSSDAAAASPDTATNSSRDPARGLNPAALAELLGGPSDADLMRMSMSAIATPTTSAAEREVAWDNFEQLVEQLDNANNIAALGLWAPLLAQLGAAEAEDRRMAAWCVSTAVQNNVKSQEAMLAAGGVPLLVRLVSEDGSAAVRKKAASALSSEVRNFQPGLDEMLLHLPRELGGQQKGLDAGDMEAVDGLMEKLREHAAKASS